MVLRLHTFPSVHLRGKNLVLAEGGSPPKRSLFQGFLIWGLHPMVLLTSYCWLWQTDVIRSPRERVCAHPRRVLSWDCSWRWGAEPAPAAVHGRPLWMARVQIRCHFSPNVNLFQLHTIQIKYLAEAGRTSECQRNVRRAGNKY